MLAGVSTRCDRRTQEPVGAGIERAGRSKSESSVSRAFVKRTREALGKLMARRLDDVRCSAVIMLDGIELKGRTNVVALRISTEGVKIPLGRWEGSTENATVATALLSDLVERGLDPEQGMLFVTDGAKALRKAIRAASASARPSSGASATRSAMCSTTSPIAIAPRSSVACAALGRTTTML